MIILDGVAAVYRHDLPDHRRPPAWVTLEEPRQLEAQNQFLPRSMRGGIEAAIFRLERGGEELIGSHPEAWARVWCGHARTRITKE
jgi:carbamate kinase